VIRTFRESVALLATRRFGTFWFASLLSSIGTWTLLVAVLSLAADLVWIVAAMVALVTERMPAALADFLALTLRVQLRFAAYHLSLVDRYPSLEGSVVASLLSTRR
jgi:Domain of unknown function (DUF4389)